MMDIHPSYNSNLKLTKILSHTGHNKMHLQHYSPTSRLHHSDINNKDNTPRLIIDVVRTCQYIIMLCSMKLSWFLNLVR